MLKTKFLAKAFYSTYYIIKILKNICIIYGGKKIQVIVIIYERNKI